MNGLEGIEGVEYADSFLAQWASEEGLRDNIVFN